MLFRLLVGVLAMTVAGCSMTRPAGSAGSGAPRAAAGERATPLSPFAQRPPQDRPEHLQASVPVSAGDPQWGSVDAPVTVVEFSDFQCPFCSRVQPTLEALKQEYGPEQLRIVWKNNPLPFHEQAAPAHTAAVAVHMLAGSEAFFRFRELAFANQQALSRENVVRWAQQVGVSREALQAWIGSGKPAQKLSEDMKVAESVGATGTPAFRINGVTLSGAQPIENFREVIDQQLSAARALTSAGTQARMLYPLLTRKNFVPPSPRPERAEEDGEDLTVWRVPVLADDPQRGPADALVTIVAFSDFECPFCKRVEPALSRLLELYPKDVRLVWKDNPLPFHPRANAAAIFARVAYQKHGNAGFWRLHDALFDSQPELDEEVFEQLARRHGLPWAQVRAELGSSKLQQRIDDSVELAEDFKVNSVPQFFINGRRFVGAQPLEAFVERVDEELAKARALSSSVPRAKLYAQLMQSAEGPAPAERKQVPRPIAAAARGDANAPVLIQIFSDFQCPFCKRVEPTLSELEQLHKGSIRIVWRHLPLPFHAYAQLAAEAAEEVLAQRGDAGFWAYHDLLFQAQSEPGGLKRASLVQMASSMGLDMPRFEAALDTHVHAAKVNADAALAEQAGITATPSFVVNDYYLSGAQPAKAFSKLIKRALKERRKP